MKIKTASHSLSSYSPFKEILHLLSRLRPLKRNIPAPKRRPPTERYVLLGLVENVRKQQRKI